jgi:hypothetical protein
MNIWSGNLRKIRVTANKNKAILEPQAIFNEISASGFSFCSLLFLDIKKPQPLDFSRVLKKSDSFEKRIGLFSVLAL